MFLRSGQYIIVILHSTYNKTMLAMMCCSEKGEKKFKLMRLNKKFPHWPGTLKQAEVSETV